MLPIPESILPNPFSPQSKTPCPCNIFQHIHPKPKQYRTEVFYSIEVDDNGTSIALDPEEANRSVRKLQEFDATSNVFVVPAHDTSLPGIIETYPKTANDWASKGWKQKATWKFLADWKVEGRPE